MDERYKSNNVSEVVRKELAHHARDLHAKSTLVKAYAKTCTSTRAKRAELMLEELAELLEAMSSGDITMMADAIADLLYVTYGTAVAFGIPIESVFQEVHRSNMTKGTNANLHHEGGDKGKGDGYRPPDIADAILRGSQDAFHMKTTREAIERVTRSFDAAVFLDRDCSKLIKVDVADAYIMKAALQ